MEFEGCNCPDSTKSSESVHNEWEWSAPIVSAGRSQYRLLLPPELLQSSLSALGKKYRLVCVGMTWEEAHYRRGYATVAAEVGGSQPRGRPFEVAVPGGVVM